ncbi:MAG: WD40 repeat domain-containing protein [Kofleriaceae bacterium]
MIADVSPRPPRPLRDWRRRCRPELLAVRSTPRWRAIEPGATRARRSSPRLRQFLTGQLVAAPPRRASAWRFRPSFTAAVVISTVAALALGVAARCSGCAASPPSATRRPARARRGRGRARHHQRPPHRAPARARPSPGARGPRRARALVHLAEAARAPDPPDAALRFLIGRAVDALISERAAEVLPAPLVDVRLDAGSDRVVVGMAGGAIAVRAMTTAAAGPSLTVPEPITDLAIVDDGATLLSAGPSLGRYALATGHALAPAEETTPPIVRVARVGEVEAHGLFGGEIELRGAGAPRRWRGHPVDLSTFVLARDGSRLLTRDDDHTAALWDVATGAELGRWRGVWSAELVPDEPRFALGFEAGGLRLCTLADARCEVAVPTAPRVAWQAFAPGRIATASDGGHVDVWRTTDGEHLATFAGHPSSGLVAVAFDPAGELLASADGSGVVRLFLGASGDLLGTYDTYAGATAALGFSADGATLVVVSYDGQLRWLEVGALRHRVALVGHAGEARRVAYAPDGATVYTASRDGAVGVWDAATGAPRARRQLHAGGVRGLDVAGDGRHVATGGVDGAVRLLAPTGADVATLAGHEASVAVVRFLEGGRALASGDDAGWVRLWDVDGARLRCALELGGPVIGLTASADGASVLAYGEARHALRVSAQTCEVVQRFDPGQSATLSAALSPDGREVTFAGLVRRGSGSGGLARFALADGAALPLTLARLHEEVITAAYADDGRTLAASAFGGEVLLIDVGTGRIRETMRDAHSVVGSLQFFADGRLLAGGGDDGLLRTWDVATGTLLAADAGHAGGIYFMRLRPDGRQLATAALDDTPRLWPLPRWDQGGAALDRVVACRAGWRLVGTRLVARAPGEAARDPRCAAPAAAVVDRAP